MTAVKNLVTSGIDQLIAVLPAIVYGTFVQTDRFSLFFGGTSLLIMVSVILDTVQQVNTYLLNHHYNFIPRADVEGAHREDERVQSRGQAHAVPASREAGEFLLKGFHFFPQDVPTGAKHPACRLEVLFAKKLELGAQGIYDKNNCYCYGEKDSKRGKRNRSRSYRFPVLRDRKSVV